MPRARRRAEQEKSATVPLRQVSGCSAAKAGFLYGSSNAGSLRVLVPRSIEGWLAEMRTGKEALLSVGREANRDVLVVIFDDGSEEPYSIAMTAVEAFNSFNTPVTIVASDLDTNVLATAAKGVYTHDRVDKLSPERLSRFFVRGTGAQEGEFTVKPELRRMITFQRLNLLEPNWSLRGPFDVLFCRNVMIYFDKPTQYKILKRFAPLMSENGLLFAGHSESFLHAADIFRSQGKTVYQLASVGRSHGG